MSWKVTIGYDDRLWCNIIIVSFCVNKFPPMTALKKGRSAYYKSTKAYSPNILDPPPPPQINHYADFKQASKNQFEWEDHDVLVVPFP